MTVDILLSTYNGEKYLDDLIKSLYLQTYKNWNLIIRDDQSTDSTIEKIKNLKMNDPERIKILDSNNKNLGPKKSFEELLNVSNAEYIMFCDQDDYWLSTKVEASINRVKQIEASNPNKPVLLCTDLAVTDNNLNLINRSLWKFTKVDPNNIYHLYKLSINNPVVGCTVTINKKAKEKILPIHDCAIMHDWWSALVISNNGIMDYLKKPMILYRTHENNHIGAVKANGNFYKGKIFHFQETVKNNRKAFKMLKEIKPNASYLTFLYYKGKIILSKFIKK